ncbi:MAG: hypothetical protein JXQ73_22135 [Phycisphaerae bacterium]|nr:hypothetical protein [Phycisphaerae bacterium]
MRSTFTRVGDAAWITTLFVGLFCMLLSSGSDGVIEPFNAASYVLFIIGVLLAAITHGPRLFRRR